MRKDVIGLVPAAGMGTRLSPLPFSKELYPIGFERSREDSTKEYPKVVSAYLLEQMRAAGAENIYFIIRKGKWDIPNYFGDGSRLNLNLAYLIMQQPYGAPFSLDQAYNFVRGKTVVFGFPDILIEPQDAFTQLLAHQHQTNADVVLGVHQVEHPHKWDMVALTETGEVTTILPKPEKSDLSHAWAFACWGELFTDFMHQYLYELLARQRNTEASFEVSVGEVIQAAIDNGLRVQSVCFHGYSCLDVGTPEDLKKAIQAHTH
ncbi:sugar phosphate nucleotidyltransferase [Pontibacter sp. SGAir0037]|uniref:sugar phosphate nucleotidyltransferase n=1 Tax=Pontibacter sp. SGAir0037 TaxID=2571030 RepID=UPI0010CCF0DC|nr:sugar phosphate nucleotidyltransferase [Pontibacter sp. SGAir0037]QCR22827.1 dTDP-glucose pyrophosphorylase [Pontibacter sp. SGAir0037]